MWDEELCIQCGKCVLVCPHAVIRAKVYDAPLLERSTTSNPQSRAGANLKRCDTRSSCSGRLHRLPSVRGSLPGKEQERSEAQSDQYGEQPPLHEAESKNWDFFLSIPELDRDRLTHSQ